ncbi:uncharacterized protein V1518DRAFT_407051 [Limtongia smithiae]|uniref:uncharacterized protein n=1 Tax=Limtongia smithiae TaxID=1125753 RepID=UPI0034CD2333
MSSADVHDVLEIEHLASAARPQPPNKKLKTEGRKLDGINRELHNLLGENTPAVTVIQNKFKAKPNWKAKPSPWVWTKFKNQARTDDLELYHWVRGTASEDEYVFAKFNKTVDVPTYTTEEYDKCLADTAWTPRETEYLFGLCREYDLRWLVLQDRYEYEPEENEPPSMRTLEDLKDRYYDCCRKLMDFRRESGVMEWTAQDLELYNAMSFKKDKEIARKEYLERLLSRTPSEIAEEEKLILEYRRLQDASKKLVEDRQNLLRLLESPQTSSTFAPFQSSQGLSQLAANILAAEKSRRRKNVAEMPATGIQQQAAKALGHSQTTAAQASAQVQAGFANAAYTKQQHGTAPSSLSASSGSKQQSAPVSKVELAQNIAQKKVAKRVPPGKESSYGISFHEKLTQGVYLRSTRTTSLKPTVQAKVASVLAELDISSKLAMPTAKVCDKFELLQQSINVLLETKRQADKLEAEVRVLQQKPDGDNAADEDAK